MLICKNKLVLSGFFFWVILGYLALLISCVLEKGGGVILIGIFMC